MPEQVIDDLTILTLLPGVVVVSAHNVTFCWFLTTWYLSETSANATLSNRARNIRNLLTSGWYDRVLCYSRMPCFIQIRWFRCFGVSVIRDWNYRKHWGCLQNCSHLRFDNLESECSRFVLWVPFKLLSQVRSSMQMPRACTASICVVNVQTTERLKAELSKSG